MIQNKFTTLDQWNLECILYNKSHKKRMKCQHKLRETSYNTLLINLPSLLDLTSFHRNGGRGTGVGTLDVVFVIRHGAVRFGVY